MQQLCHIKGTTFIIILYYIIIIFLLIWVAPLAETSRKVRRLVLVMTAMWVEEQRAIPAWMGRERMSFTIEKVMLKIRLSRSRPWRHIRSWKVIDPLILTFGTSWRWVVNFTPRPLHWREWARPIWIRGWMGRTACLDCYGGKWVESYTSIPVTTQQCIKCELSLGLIRSSVSHKDQRSNDSSVRTVTRSYTSRTGSIPGRLRNISPRPASRRSSGAGLPPFVWAPFLAEERLRRENKPHPYATQSRVYRICAAIPHLSCSR